MSNVAVLDLAHDNNEIIVGNIVKKAEDIVRQSMDRVRIDYPHTEKGLYMKIGDVIYTFTLRDDGGLDFVKRTETRNCLTEKIASFKVPSQYRSFTCKQPNYSEMVVDFHGAYMRVTNFEGNMITNIEIEQ